MILIPCIKPPYLEDKESVLITTSETRKFVSDPTNTQFYVLDFSGTGANKFFLSQANLNCIFCNLKPKESQLIQWLAYNLSSFIALGKPEYYLFFLSSSDLPC